MKIKKEDYIKISKEDIENEIQKIDNEFQKKIFEYEKYDGIYKCVENLYDHTFEPYFLRCLDYQDKIIVSLQKEIKENSNIDKDKLELMNFMIDSFGVICPCCFQIFYDNMKSLQNIRKNPDTIKHILEKEKLQRYESIQQIGYDVYETINNRENDILDKIDKMLKGK